MSGSRVPRDALALAVLFATSGVLHLIRPQIFETIVPSYVPAPRAMVYASGVAEIGCAAGLVGRRTRRVAGLASMALLIAVFPANIEMAVDSTRSSSRWFQAVAFLRLPLQVPMIWVAYRAARGGQPRGGGHNAGQAAL